MLAVAEELQEAGAEIGKTRHGRLVALQGNACPECGFPQGPGAPILRFRGESAKMRIQREEQRRQELAGLERDYRAKLVSALEVCAAGSWGLFGQNDHLAGAERWNAGSGAEELLELGAAIAEIRAQLGLDPFALHARFLASRGRAGANAPGESKIARAWLDELKRDGDT